MSPLAKLTTMKAYCSLSMAATTASATWRALISGFRS